MSANENSYIKFASNSVVEEKKSSVKSSQEESSLGYKVVVDLNVNPNAEGAEGNEAQMGQNIFTLNFDNLGQIRTVTDQAGDVMDAGALYVTLNIAINVLGAYVHTCRLQYVEFFGKFYMDGGEPFEPMGQKTKYIRVMKDK